MALTKRKDGRWCKSKTINGTRIFFYSSEETERKALRDIEKQMLEYSGKRETGLSFCEVAAEWERLKREDMEPVTWQKCYQAAYAQTLEAFSDINIREITPLDIDRYFKRLKSEKYSQKSVATRKSVLNMVFEHAFVCGYIQNNFILSVPLPAGLSKKPRKNPTKDEIKIATSNYEGDDFLFYFLAYTGLRISEACALTDKDIDYENNLIYVNKKVVWESSKPIIKNKTKTDAGDRAVPLLNELRAHIPQFNGYLFSRSGGKTPLTKGQLRRWTDGYKAKHGVTFTPHQLRHAYATLGVEAGLSVKELQYTLGHADIHTTMDIYAEIRESQRRVIADKLNMAKY